MTRMETQPVPYIDSISVSVDGEFHDYSVSLLPITGKNKNVKSSTSRRAVWQMNRKNGTEDQKGLVACNPLRMWMPSGSSKLLLHAVQFLVTILRKNKSLNNILFESKFNSRKKLAMAILEEIILVWIAWRWKNFFEKKLVGWEELWVSL